MVITPLPLCCNCLRSAPFRIKLNRLKGVVQLAYAISGFLVVKMQQSSDQTTLIMDAAIVAQDFTLDKSVQQIEQTPLE